MKNKLPLILLPILFLSCTKIPTVEGKWETNFTSISDMKKDKDSDQVDFQLHVSHKIVYNFYPNKSFQKTVSQNIQSIENLSGTNLEYTKDDFAKLMDNVLTITGTYDCVKRKIFFYSDKVKTKDGEEINFETYALKNPLIGEQDSAEYFNMDKFGNLQIGEFIYTCRNIKSED